MNINKIFSLFNSSDESKNDEISSQINTSIDPINEIEVFKRMIFNYETSVKHLIQLFNTANPPLDLEEIERASCQMVYNKAYDHLIKINLTDSSHIKTLKSLSDDNFKKVLDKALNYFIQNEEYEKCVFLKQVHDIINSF